LWVYGNSPKVGLPTRDKTLFLDLMRFFYVENSLDYYSFGMLIPERFSSSSDYRYGYGGHEKDDEVSGKGNHLAFGDYGYNPRLARRFQIDPMIGTFPWMSPYAIFNNNPIYFIDPTGMSPESDAPIFDTDGNLLGTDDEGWEGEAIVMDKSDFKQEMKHKEALDKGTELKNYEKGIKISDKDWKKVEDNGGTQLQSTVKNFSKNTIFYKPENDDTALPIESGKDLYTGIDGLNVSGTLYKVPDEVKTTVVTAQEIVSLRTNGVVDHLIMEAKILDFRIHYLPDWKDIKQVIK